MTIPTASIVESAVVGPTKTNPRRFSSFAIAVDSGLVGSSSPPERGVGRESGSGAKLHMSAFEHLDPGHRSILAQIHGGSPRPVRAPDYVQVVPEDPDRQELLTALTTEHFTLQGARSQTISESGTRATLYVMAVSSALVALGFIGQVSEVGEVFDVFALTVLPTLYVLGLFTFVRLVETSVEDILYGRAINRIRAYYLQRAGSESGWFMLGAYDDPLGVITNMGIRPARMQLYFTAGMMIAVINSVVGGSAIAIAIGAIADPPLGIAVAAGAAAALLSLVALTRLDRRMHEAGRAGIEPMFPSPGQAS